MSAAIIGREQPLAALAGAIERLDGGPGGCLLVTGEAGIGKTTLVAAAVARASGALVVSGTCWDGDGAPGGWPWIQVVRAVERSVGPDEWSDLRAAAGDALAHLLGEVGEPRAAGETSGEFPVFDAVTTLLATAASTRPVVVVIDDLHWADPMSVRLLDFVVRHTALARVLVIAAYRDDEVAPPEHPLHALVTDLVPRASTVALGGLDARAVGELMAAGGDGSPDDVVAEVHRRTGGNPFFVEQLARLWSLTGSAGGFAPAVADAVDRRLAHLPTGCVDVLATAALLGTEFDRVVLAAACGLGREVDDPLERAATAGLVVSAGPDRARFVHDLVREVLAASLGDTEARARHAAIVRAAASAAVGARLLPAQRAMHAALAVPDLDVAVAVALLHDAAADAAARLAYEEAAGHDRRALDLLGDDSGPERDVVALALGSHLHQAGALDDARATFEAVARDARGVDAETFAHAVLGLHALGRAVVDDVTGDLALLEEADAALGATAAHRGGSALRARVLAAASRARTHHLQADRTDAEVASAAALEMARMAGDPEALGFCLLARHDAIWAPGTAASRLALADEMEVVARRSGDRDLELQGSFLRMVALLETGAPSALDAHRSFVAAAERTRLPRFRYLARSRNAAVAMLTGRFGEAASEADAARELGHQMGEVDTESVWHEQLWELTRLVGDREQMDALRAELTAAPDPLQPVIEAMYSLGTGDTAGAVAWLPQIDAVSAQWPRWARLMWFTFRAELAAGAMDTELCAEVAASLEQYADQWVLVAGAVIVHGPVAYWLGLVEGARGRHEDAIAWFVAATEQAARLGARPWAVRAALGHAGVLASRDEAGDRAAAAVLLDAVELEARELGMVPATVEADARRARIGAPVAGANVFRCDGDVWTLTYAGATVVVPDAKGLHDLRTLLGSPGTDVPAISLLDPNGGEVVTTARRLGGDPVLDERARTAYRDRLASLDDDIERALARHDDRRAVALEAERDALIDELRRATGLGGRPRRLGDEAERARKTVTARIRDTVRRLEPRHPALAAHLQSSVGTGAMCRYDPSEPISWTF